MTDDELDDVTAPLPIAQSRRVLSAVGDPTTLVPGAIVAGRYRLTVFYGASRHVQFWQGIDTVTGATVGLSLVDVEGQLDFAQVDEILSLTVRLRGLDVIGVARILHVMHTGSFGLAATEWVHGGSLREVADTSPSPTAAAMALKSLIVAADVAHRAGLTLSIDHPGRIRISTEGDAVLAFPASLPEASVRDDLRGIGGAFYALLIDRWLADDPMPAGWVAADLDEAGWPEEPAAVDRRIPFLLSSAAAGLVRPDNGVDSAAELLGLLRLALGEANTAAFQRDSPAEVVAPLAAPAPGGYADFRNVDPNDRVRQARRRLVQGMLAAAAVIIVAGVAMLGSTLNDVFSRDNTAAIDAQRLGLNPDTPAAPVPSPVAPAPQAAAPLVPVSASVFSPDGRPDNPDDAGKVIDGDSGTVWATDRYFDADPFPKFKEGLGLLVKLPQPTALDSVTVDLRSSGTVIQIRGASGDPATLADTVELSAPTPMQPGTNRIALTNRTPTPNVLVWIATLGSTDGDSRAEISEISLSPTGRA